MNKNINIGEIKQLGLDEYIENTVINIIEQVYEFIKLLENTELDSLVRSDEGFVMNDKKAGNKLREIIDQFINTFKNEFEKNENIQDCKNYNIFLKFLKQKLHGEKFWVEIDLVIQRLLEPYKEAIFLREFPSDVVRLYFREIIENRILIANKIDFVTEQLKCQFSEDQIEIGEKIIEYSISLVIEDRYSFNLFLSSIKKMFGLSDKISELIWDTINRNKSDLVSRYIINELIDIKKAVNILMMENDKVDS